MDSCDLAALFDHAFCICCGGFHLTADRSVYDGSDLFDNLIEVTSLFCDQGWVCGHSTDDSHVICLADVFYICSVDKKSHNFFLPFKTFALSFDTLSLPHKTYLRKSYRFYK